MLHSVKDTEGLSIETSEGTLGHVRDVYIDDKSWTIRYLVVDTGHWLSNRKVLISPIAVNTLDWHNKVVAVSMTKEQVEHSPNINTDKPVSRQQENDYHAYFDYGRYWSGPGPWGAAAYPRLLIPGYASLVPVPQSVSEAAEEQYMRDDVAQHRNDDHRLRSCNEIINYHIHATDGDLGHVRDFLFDEESWAVRYLVMQTSNWWVGHATLIAPQWIIDVSWPDQLLSVNVSRQAVKDAPPYDSALEVSPAQDRALLDHYGHADKLQDDSS